MAKPMSEELVGFLLHHQEKVVNNMASYHFEVKSGKKGSASDHSRYIAREGGFDKWDDLLATEVGNMPPWAANDHALFWQSADTHERANGAAYREFIIALPNELSLQQNLEIVRTVVRELVGDKPYQVALHGPESKLSGIKNVHAHVMFSDREPDGLDRTPEKTFARYNEDHPERGGCKKASGGKTSMQVRDELIARRKMVADALNHGLANAGVDARVNHRSYKDRGIQQKPEHHFGPARINRMSPAERAEHCSGRGKRRRS